MKPNWVRTYHTAGFVQILAIGVAALWALSDKADVAAWTARSPLIGNAFAWMQSVNWMIAPAAVGVIAVAAAGRKKIGAPWIWDTIAVLFEEYREYCFREAQAQQHLHRITLFKRVRWCFAVWPFKSPRWPWGKGRWPWSGWLVAKVRTGHFRHRCFEAFLASDDASTEGVAGKAFMDGTYHVSGLPSLNASSSEDDIRRYAKETRVSEEWVRRRIRLGKPLSRAFSGLVVEVEGRPWGVIVIDSSEPDGIKEQAFAPHRFKPMAKALSLLLERV